jgi:catechol 2,3-dioxygenase
MTTKLLDLPDPTTAPTAPAEPGTYGIEPRGYRLPKETRLGGVRVQVSDLGRSVDWYRDNLGLAVLHLSNREAGLGAAGNNGPLVALVERPDARPVPQRGRTGLYHFAILLPDRPSLGRFLTHLSDRGLRAGAADHLVSEALYLHDPDGLGIEVYVDRPRSAWERQGRELAMATLPLDAQDLTRAAAGKPWTGMPAGTVLGHVHLHVGELEAAAAFYHAGLGLDAMVWSYPGALFLSAGGYHHHLGLNTWSGPGSTPPAEDEAQLLEWDIVLPAAEDVSRAGKSLSHAGYAVSPGDRGWTAADPWGTRVRVRQG